MNSGKDTLGVGDNTMKKYKKTDRNRILGMSLGMCFGVAIGTGFSNSMDIGQGLGLSLGLCFGMCVGMALGNHKDNLINKQLEQQGYTISHIEPADAPNTFAVTIVNYAGEKQTLSVPKGELEAETLKIGDVVYLDEEGHLEQVFTDED